MRRWTKALLGSSAMVLALGSWTVTRVGADDEQDAVEPAVLPPMAFLTGLGAVRSAQLEGVEVAVERVEGGYELTFVNPSATERALRWQVECSRVAGSPMSRMGPIAIRVHQEVLALRVPARGRATHVIRVDHPVAPEEPVLGFGSFASMRVLLTSTEPSDSPPAFAMLSVPSAVAPSTVPSAPAVAVGS